MFYKGCKKNTHRLWKSNGEGRCNNEKSKSSFSNKHLKSNFFAPSLSCQDDEKLRENLRTTEKMNQLKIKMELANARKKLKSLKLSSKTKKITESVNRQDFEEKVFEKSKIEKPSTILETKMPSRSLSAESKTRIKENLSRNRSFKTILNTSSFDSTAPSLFNNVNTFEVCNKLGRSFSFQSNYVFGRNEESQSQMAALDTASFSPSPTVISETSEVNDEKCSTSMQDLLLKEFFSPDRDFGGSKCALNELSCTSGNEINEYFILPKFLVRKNSTVMDPKPEASVKLLDVQESIEQPPAESLVDFCNDLTSSSTSLVSKINEYSYFPALAPASNRFYHSDLDLNQITERFKNKLSFSHQEINSNDTEWSMNTNENSRVHPSAVDDCEEKCLSRNLEEIKYNKFLNDLLNTDPGDESLLFDLKSTQSTESKTVGYKAKSFSSNQLEVDKPPLKTLSQSHQKKLPPLWSKNSATDKLKSFGSNPVLRTNLCTNQNISLANSTTTVHIPQLSSRLEDIPLINRRGYINLNDACLSNSGDINRTEMSSDQKVQVSDDDLATSRFNGRQSRFEYCRNTIFSNAPKSSFLNPTLSRKHSLNLDCQSEENIFNINIDSFYDDYVDSAEWSSSSSSESLESSCTSSLGLEKKYLALPEIKLDQTELKTGAISVDTITVEKNNVPTNVENLNSNNEELELSGKLRCSKCRKKLGIVMVFKCHCEKYFCSTHRYSSTHDCNFDYKTHAREVLARENPLCVTEKLPKI